MARGYQARESGRATKTTTGGALQNAFASRVASMKSKPTVATVSKFLKENVDNPKFKAEIMKIGSFVETMNAWQANSGAVDREKMISEFKELPAFFRDSIQLPPQRLVGLWRGADLGEVNGGGELSSSSPIETVKAFSDSPFAARFFGNTLYTFEDIESQGGVIDTDKVAKIIDNDFVDKFNSKYDDELEIDNVGDDEGEKIAYDIKWKKGVGSDEWALKTQPKRYEETRKFAERHDEEEMKNGFPSYLDKDGRFRFIGEDGENKNPDDGKPGMQAYDPVTLHRIRPPVELELKNKMPSLFGRMTKEEQALFDKMSVRG